MQHKRLLAGVLALATLAAGCGAGARKGDFSAPWRPVELGADSASAMPPVYVPPAGEAPAAPAEAVERAEPAEAPSAPAEPNVVAVKPPAVSEDPPIAVSAPDPVPTPRPAEKEEPAPVKPPATTPGTKPEPAKPAPEPKPEPDPAEPTPEPKPEPMPEPQPQPAPLPPPVVMPAPTDSLPAGLTADEQLMVRLVNEERAKAGLPALEVDLHLVQTARAKSQDMITYNYFAHDSARLGSPFDQMTAAGIRYSTAGENIAGNPSVEGAHRTLINSSGHRANILSKSFKKFGIGIIHGGKYGIMFTQQFIG